MDSLEPKKLALLRILQILHRYSDADHPLKQDEIAAMLLREYGLEIERKAISRNISLLKESGVDIESTRCGCFLAEREFEDAELRLLIDGVLSSKYITASHSRSLINKLTRLGNKYFRPRVRNVYSVNDWDKSDNSALFYNIEIVDEAIDKERKISFSYLRYGADKRRHIAGTHIVSPYQLVLHNQRYYLMAFAEKWQEMTFFRLDRIADIALVDEPLKPLRSVKGYESGINYRDLATTLPYMYTDGVKTVSFTCEEWMMDHVLDWFGRDVTVVPTDGMLKVTVRSSEQAMEYWAMQYLNAIEVVSPLSLREKIKQNLIAAQKKYD